MADWLELLTSEHVRKLVPYESARRLFAASEGQSRIWLNANESPETSEYSLQCESLNRYPDCQPQSVIDGYARYTGLKPEQILVTRGADEGIELLIRAFCQSGTDSILICPPTYGMYAISANTFDVGVEKAVLKDDFSLDLNLVNSYVGKVKLVFLCSPNNPTGTLIAPDSLISILETYAHKAIVVLDEAYIEFSSNTTQSALLAKYPHLVILRTLSKGFALAGIRCGFVLSCAAIKQILLKVIAPYPVPDPVAQIATQALGISGVSHMQGNVAKLSQELQKLALQLSQISDVTLVGSQGGNFVLFKTAYSKALMQYLVDNNMLIRDQSKQVMLNNCLRISVGTHDQNIQVMNLIKSFFQQHKGSNQTSQKAVS
jgi:histidinol-phosphate aminotransferase